ncbi:F-box protein At5g49610-like [Nymphaea colorata]|uniref:F-box domain-containing protein n=1 Tax=Nymphaea colorata TaxID=210225 RepID=A0A5K1BVE4_9MAGN|nr:F-box protein At5g49610-like [Nymphaea colorata]
MIYTMEEGCPFNEDIYRNILSRFPAKLLLQYKIICKQWNSIISDLHFTSEQARHSCTAKQEFFASIYSKSSRSFLWNASSAGIPSSLQGFLQQKGADLVASCNGLLCCWNYDGLSSSVSILNPINMDFFTLPPPIQEETPMDPESPSRFSTETSVGLAFDPCISTPSFNYKVVLVQALVSKWEASYESCHDVKFQIYSSQTGAWAMSNETNVCRTVSDSCPVFHGGILFWLCIREHILAFDVEKEESWLMKFPSGNVEEKIMNSNSPPCWDDEWLGASEGSLYFVRTGITRLNIWTAESCRPDAKWLMKYSVCLQTVVDNHFYLLNSIVKKPTNCSDEMVCLRKNSHLKLHEMDTKLFHPLCYCGDGIVLLRAADSILSYNVKTKKLNERLNSPNMNFVCVYPYSSSLMSMKLFQGH